MPTDDSSVDRLERALSLLATRDMRRAYIESVVRRAGVDISPLGAWLLVRMSAEPELDIRSSAEARGVDRDRFEDALDGLMRRGLVRESVVGPGAAKFTQSSRSKLASAAETRFVPSEDGNVLLDRLADARRAHLMEVVSEFPPEQRARLAAVIGEMVPDEEHPAAEPGAQDTQ